MASAKIEIYQGLVSMANQQARVRTLSVENFSSIDSALITFGPITIITGPQGSGKSILCKLLYFCQLPFDALITSALDGDTFKDFVKSTEAEFETWFPPAAWGPRRFSIVYISGEYVINIRRSANRKGTTNKAIITFGQLFESLYNSLVSDFRDMRRERFGDHPEDLRDRYYYDYNLKRHAERSIVQTFRHEATRSQLYIPAGRAFFTTVGKTVAAFDQVNLFDPVTTAFGRQFLAIRESALRMGLSSQRSYEYIKKSSAVRMAKFNLADVFGGEIKTQKGEIFVQTLDDRTIPINALSSGQQELLPLWLAIDNFAFTGAVHQNDVRDQIMYIEEPEAHLFPSAQASLIRYIIGMTSPQNSLNMLVITTHSPYILSQINNLIKAGQVGFKKRLVKQDRVKEVYDKDLWLPADIVYAYGIEDREIRNLLDDTGMISAEYIDAVSSEMLNDYERLLDVEYGEIE